MSSSPRGGSTFANDAVGIHPNILMVRWNDKTLAKVWPRRKLPDAEFRQLVLREPTYWNPDAAAKILSPNDFYNLKSLIDRVCERRQIGEMFCLHGLLYWVMVNPAFDLDSMRYWVVKTNTLENIYLIGRALPKLRFIMIQRDPRPVSLSLAKVFANRGRFDNDHVVRGVVDWSRQASRCASFMVKMNDRAIGIRYEGLVLDAEATLNNVYDYLGLSRLLPSEIQEGMDRIPFKRTGSVYDKPFDAENPRPVGIQTEGLGRWKKQLSAEQKQIICFLAYRPARYFGYRLTRPKDISLSFIFSQIRRRRDKIKQLLRWISSVLIIVKVRCLYRGSNVILSKDLELYERLNNIDQYND